MTANTINCQNRDFSNRNLAKVDFSNRILVGANFEGSDCSGCDFKNSDLSFAVFKNTNLYKADFAGSILYVTYFEDCDLTRAIFRESYPYGIKFVGNVNVTYCDFANFQIENKRRYSNFDLEDNSFQKVNFGSKINHNNDLSNFVVNGKKVAFRDFGSFEKEMQKSQIYNRLKRVFTENRLMDEASNYHFYEKYWLTRSWYLNVPIEDNKLSYLIKNRISRTVASYISELISGYGERPGKALRALLIWVFLFAGFYPTCPIIWERSYIQIDNTMVSYSKIAINNVYTFFNSLYYSFASFTGFGNMQANGYARVFTILEIIIALLFITVFISSVIRKMIRE